jgi:small GTP-binding protein
MQQPTIAASFFSRTTKLADGTYARYDIWDTAGQDRYRTLAPMYYRGAHGAVVVYDITDSESFVGAKAYVEELQRQGSTDIVIALCGNKHDLASRREVWEDEANEYAQQNGCIFFEISAKTGHNIVETFEALGNKLPKIAPPQVSGVVDLSAEPKQKRGCC